MCAFIKSIRKQSYDKSFFIGCLLWVVILTGVQIGVSYLAMNHSEISNDSKWSLFPITFLQLAQVCRMIVYLGQRLKAGKVLIESKPFPYQTWLRVEFMALIILAVGYEGFGWPLSAIAWGFSFMFYLATMGITLLFMGNYGSQVCRNGMWFNNKESISLHKFIPWHKIESYEWNVDRDKYIGLEIQYQLKLKLKNGKRSNKNATVELEIPMDKKEMAETILFEQGIPPS